jgi:hypothetical protein
MQSYNPVSVFLCLHLQYRCGHFTLCLCFLRIVVRRRAWFDEQLAVASKATSERGLYIGLRL